MIGLTKFDLNFSGILRSDISINDTPINDTPINDTPINNVLRILNNIDIDIDNNNYITKTYTPVGNRMYFTELNGRKIDAIRTQIDTWFRKNLITLDEHDFLIGCLIVAISLVSNTAGTYGAYNKKWDKRAEKTLKLLNPFNISDKKHTVLNGNVKNLIDSCDDYDILYLDPPYNERQYGNYYHLLETIVRNDKPEVKGVTGVRDCSDIKSDFCVAKLVEPALEEIIRKSKSAFVIMSYNNEGLMTKDRIMAIMGKFGDISCEEIPYERYNRVKDKGSNIIEYIFTLRRRVTLPNSISLPCWYNKIYNMDCIEGMKLLPDRSIDMIFTDLPYGLTECKWDSVIPLKDLWDAYKRVIKLDGAIVLFAQQPFTSVLVSSNLDMFKYSLVWKKTKTGNFAQAPYRFLCEHEDILVFSYGKVSKNGVPRMKYFPQGTVPCNKKMKGKTGNTEHREGRSVQKDYIQTVTNYPRTILEFGNEGRPEHPTQKPVDICEYLIRTYTSEGDVVLDSCMGACTTAVAAISTGRHYVGYEKEQKYYDIGLKRIGLID
jgi:site-specific DNA-methyltransferase (adenine-specific)